MSRCVFVQRQAAPTCVAVRRQDAPQLSAPHPPRPALAPDVTVASRTALSQLFLVTVGLSGSTDRSMAVWLWGSHLTDLGDRPHL